MRSLTAQRVLRDVEVLAHAGLDLDTFAEESVVSIGRALPHVGMCFGTVDPTTQLLTGTRKYGDLRGKDAHDAQWGVIEYGHPEPSAFLEMMRRDINALAIDTTGGRDSTRLAEFLEPHFGYSRELRMIMTDRSHVWGHASFFRGVDDAAFGDEDVALMASLSQPLAVGVRVGLLVGYAAEEVAPPSGPAVLIVGSDDAIHQLSTGAEQRLSELTTTTTEPSGTIMALVSAARRFAAGQVERPPRCRVRTRTGMWLVLHATPMSPRGDLSGDVVVTIDEARPPEIVPLVVAAFDLSPRERQVIEFVLQGVDTKEIAGAMHLSTYTVQDHLKSIFGKVSVRSRRELIARVYFDQYVPRMGTDVGPGGWFAG